MDLPNIYLPLASGVSARDQQLCSASRLIAPKPR